MYVLAEDMVLSVILKRITAPDMTSGYEVEAEDMLNIQETDMDSA